MTVKLDAWVSEHLGKPAYNLLDPEAIPERFPGNAFVSTRVPLEEVATMARLADIGFRLADVTSTFERPARPLPKTSAGNVTVRLAEPPDAQALAEVARVSFAASRFHRDPQIPDAVAGALKAAWALNNVRGIRGDRVYLAEFRGEPCGFLSRISETMTRKTRRTIDLIAVRPSEQRQGTGSALLAALALDAQPDDILRVGTQASNIPSIRFYERHGFQLVESTAVLHLHTGPGPS